MKPARLRAPREDGALLISPDWAELPGLVETNRNLIRQSTFGLGGRSLGELRHWAKESAQVALAEWYGELGWERCSLQSPLIMTGHQPELFHPGVWAKNVAVSRLARKLSGSSLNINVDSDVAKNTSLRLPLLDGHHVQANFAFSKVNAPIPYEEWKCDDEAKFAAFPNTVEEETQQWPWQPVLPEFWQSAVAARSHAATIPERWIIARHLWEEKEHVSNNELTMSRWCNTPFFRWLVEQFVAEGARFASIYNDELAAYRKVHRMRSANHPVADLLVTADLVELPFWAWRNGTTQRGRLCLKQSNGHSQLVALVSGKETPVTQHSELSTQDLEGWKIRPKALITSMMFRLFLADLFVHGIGGAVYDELTDRIFARFWKVTLPRFAVVTATLRLSWSHSHMKGTYLHVLKGELRSIEWNPDRFLKEPLSAEARLLRQRKQELMDSPATPLEMLEARHQEYDRIRNQLRPMVASEKSAIEHLLAHSQHQFKRDEVHFSREHAWVLYPRAKLEELIGAVKGLRG